MAQPLMFLPDVRRSVLDSIPQMRGVLKERGLTDIFADVPHEHMGICELTGRGPGDKSGTVICYQTPSGEIPRRLGYYPKEQAWTPVGDGSLLWLGLDTAEPPKPEEMARRNQIRGVPMKLGDGNDWIVPVICLPNGGTMLPQAIVRDNAGRQVEQVRSAYQQYWDESREPAKWMYGGRPADKFSRAQAVDYVMKVLAINYRFGWNEQNLLQLIGSDNYLTVLWLIVGGPDFEETVEKKTADRSTAPSSTLGPADESAITNPVGATCS